MSSDKNIDLKAKGNSGQEPQTPVSDDQVTIWRKIPLSDILKNVIVAVCVASIIGVKGGTKTGHRAA